MCFPLTASSFYCGRQFMTEQIKAMRKSFVACQWNLLRRQIEKSRRLAQDSNRYVTTSLITGNMNGESEWKTEKVCIVVL